MRSLAPPPFLGTLPLLAALACATPLPAAAPRPAHPPAEPPVAAAQPAAVELASAVPVFYGPEPAATPTPIERDAADALRASQPPGAPRPVVSPALTLAAREIARRAAAGEPDPIARTRLRSALAAGLCYDPAPVAVLLAAPLRHAVPAAATKAGSIAGQTHVGVGVAARDESAWVVILASRRLAVLEPFPRHVAAGARVLLRGELRGLSAPRVFVTRPSGLVREVPVSGRRPFRAEVPFESKGRYLVEIIGEGSSGPTVAALFAVSSGGARLEEPALTPSRADPADDDQAEAGVVEAINATRRRHGLAPLEPRPELSRVARHHSQSMRAAGVLAHVLPGEAGPSERLRRARIAFRRAAENIALAETALAAHAAAEESPGHRANLLDPRAEHVGCGIARGQLRSEPVVYLTEIFVEPVDDTSRSRLSPEGRVKEVLWRERARLGRPSLLQDARLDALAREAARSMRRHDEPSPAGLGDRALALGRNLAAADAFVTASPEGVLRSANLADARYRRVGVGVEVGDSPRYGAGLLWIALLFTD